MRTVSVSIIVVIYNLGVAVLGLGTTAEAVASVTDVSAMFVSIVTPLAVGRLFLVTT